MSRQVTLLALLFICIICLVSTVSAQTRGVFQVNWRIKEAVKYEVYAEQSKKAPEEITDKSLQSLLFGPEVLLSNPIFNGFMPNPRLEWGHISKLNEYTHYVSFDIGSDKTIAQIYDEVSQAAKNKEAYDALNDLLEKKEYYKVTNIAFKTTKFEKCIDATDSKKNTCGETCFPCLSGAACTSNADCAFTCVESICTDFNSGSALATMVAFVLAIAVGLIMF